MADTRVPADPVVLVTGAAQGIGAAIAASFAGRRVWAVDIDEAGLRPGGGRARAARGGSTFPTKRR